MVWGRRLDARNIARLVDDVLDTLAEFGEPGAGAQQLLAGPLATPEARVEFATRSLRRTARRLALHSPFYGRRFASADVPAARIDLAAMRRIPVTTKRDLIERPRDFLCADVAPHLATRTTGTTGRPAEIWLSRYEMELWPALGALSAVLRDELRPSDLMQVNMSSRATAAMHLSAATCRLTGTGCRLLGIVPPDDALDRLAEGRATVLSTCPSYLGELVTAARRRGMGPSDFHLRRIIVGGEVLSPTLAHAACQTLGVPHVDDSFSMTEIIPVTGRACTQGHLHHDVNNGLIELLDLQTGEPAAPGALGTLVITPYFPYRDCMPVFRYDTRDVVRRLPDEQLTCEVASIPATSQILGKVDHLLHPHGGDVIAPRQLITAIEALPTAPWPARYRATARAGRVELVLPVSAIEGYGEAAARLHFAERGLDLDLTVSHEPPTSLRRTRSDLHETSFTDQNALAGA
ncbi:MAG: AMP-binding protein [Actinomycetota bacterium]|nr:AMP-binding protein [Actinomycetota bacterium]